MPAPASTGIWSSQDNRRARFFLSLRLCDSSKAEQETEHRIGTKRPTLLLRVFTCSAHPSSRLLRTGLM